MANSRVSGFKVPQNKRSPMEAAVMESPRRAPIHSATRSLKPVTLLACATASSFLASAPMQKEAITGWVLKVSK